MKNKISATTIHKIFNKKVAVSLLGLSVMFFSVIGITVTLKRISLNVVRLINHSAEKEKFERYILPVLMFDPVPFDDVKTADEFSILRSAIWAAFLNNGKEKYLNQEYNSFIIPTSDVDVNLVMLYGSDIKIKHQTFGDGFMNNYIYDKNTNTYTVPIYDQVGMYSPEVKSISKNKDIYILTVGYIRPDDVWQTFIDDKTRKMRPEKYMEYILKKTNDGYNIISIRDSLLDDKRSKNENLKE